jgi:cell division protein FtsL
MLNLIFIYGIIYLSGSAHFFRVWYSYFQQDTKLIEREQLPFLLILLVATICWPIVVPIAYLELLKTNRLKADESAILQLVELNQQIQTQQTRIEQLQQQLAHAQSTHRILPQKVSTSASEMGALVNGSRNFSRIS